MHWAIATNRYLVHLNPDTGEGCLFCSQPETLHHLFVQCTRLAGLFRQLGTWFQGFGEQFSFCVFIYGPRYSVKRKAVHTLINFISGQAKLAIWKTRKNRVRGVGTEDVMLMLTGMLAARLRVEFEFYKLINKTADFEDMWGVQDVLCSVVENALVLNF